MSDTPETDDAVFNGFEDGAGMPDIVTADFARKLERERDEWRARFEADERLIADAMNPEQEKSIPAIQSAYLCIKTARSDCETAMFKYERAEWADAHMWVENAISQLQFSKYQLWKQYIEQEKQK